MPPRFINIITITASRVAGLLRPRLAALCWPLLLLLRIIAHCAENRGIQRDSSDDSSVFFFGTWGQWLGLEVIGIV